MEELEESQKTELQEVPQGSERRCDNPVVQRALCPADGLPSSLLTHKPLSVWFASLKLVSAIDPKGLFQGGEYCPPVPNGQAEGGGGEVMCRG